MSTATIALRSRVAGDRIVRTTDDVAGLGTVLGVWAHPDDEMYLSAGIMAAAAEAGNRVVVVTATRGEQGTDDPTRWPPARLAELRTREMAASLAVLDGGRATSNISSWASAPVPAISTGRWRMDRPTAPSLSWPRSSTTSHPTRS